MDTVLTRSIAGLASSLGGWTTSRLTLGAVASASLAPGASLREGGLELRVRTEVIATERRGMPTKTEHTLVDGIPMCAERPGVEYANRIKAGEVASEDLINFYSRHDCEHYRWWPGYRRIIEPLAKLLASREG